MYSDLECGICYRSYNLGRRCPRELQCRHSFCESCLLALALSQPQPGAANRAVVCPLCRQTTSICGGEKKLRTELKVDESVLERLLASGILDDEPEEEEAEHGQVQDACDHGEDQAPSELAGRDQTTAEQSDSTTGTGSGRLRQTLGKVWKKIIGESRQRNGKHTEIWLMGNVLQVVMLFANKQTGKHVRARHAQ